MKINEYYKLIENTEYKITGLDVDYQIVFLHEVKQVVLLFKGTDSNTDLKIDLDFPVKVYKRQSSCIKAHGGFVKAWKSANDVIMKEFITACTIDENYTPVICGHSLGGALATLASEDYYFRTGKKANLLTFGCPNVLFGKKSKEYVSSCCDDVRQYAQNNDLVPTIPYGFCQINKIKCGRKFNLFEFTFRPMKYHLGYGELEY